MNLYVFFLVLFSAFTHATWNFFSKKVAGNLKVTIAGLWIANLTLLPFTLYIVFTSGFNFHALLFMVGTSFVHVLYYWSLRRGYRIGDISTVYPVARGCGVAGTSVCAYFFLGEDISLRGWEGIALIIAGVILISFKSGLKRSDLKTLKYALIIGLSIVLYSINDKVGIAFANPVVYINFKDLLAISIMTPFLFKPGKGEIVETLKENWKYSLIIGFGALGSYLMILYAFTLERAGYVSAVREFSLVIGSFFGFIFLNEKITLKKIAGIFLVTGGLIFIKLA
jgi:drug/metabolite transporter (DMT)-like permease